MRLSRRVAGYCDLFRISHLDNEMLRWAQHDNRPDFRQTTTGTRQVLSPRPALPYIREFEIVDKAGQWPLVRLWELRDDD